MAFIIGWILGGALITGLLSFLGYLLLGTGLLVAELFVIVKKCVVMTYKVVRWIAEHLFELLRTRKGDQREFREMKQGYFICPD